MSNPKVVVIHKTFDTIDDKQKETLYVYQSGKVSRLRGAQIPKFIESLPSDMAVRTTSTNSQDFTLQTIMERGCSVFYTHWHRTGIQKNLSPAEIIERFHELDESLFKRFAPRKDIFELRQLLQIRSGIIRAKGDLIRRFKQIGRNVGLPDPNEYSESFPDLKIMLDTAKELTACITFTDKSSQREQTVEGRINMLAQTIPECVLFQQIAGLKDSWILSSSVVAIAQDMNRFDSVSSLWHYFGMHVADSGEAPRRKKGYPVTWSTAGRTTMYLLGDVIIKGTDWGGKREANPWRAVFDEFREQERDAHESKCSCKYPDSHSSARARRKTVKEILKQFYLASKGEPYTEFVPAEEKELVCV